MAAQLTTGAVAALTEHVDGNAALQPVLQVMDVRIVPNRQSPNAERFRMVLSDGVHTLQSMLATAENPRVRDGTIKKGTIIHLQEFTCSTIQTRRITIVIKLDVLQSDCDIIGNPRPYEMPNPPREQSPNLQASAAQANAGTHSTGPGMLGSSVPPRAAQVANNVPYGGYPGTGAPPTGRAAEPVPNVSSGGSNGRTSAHNTMNADTVQSNLQQPSLNSHQNQRFAVPAMAGGGGTPGNMYGRPAQPFYQQPPPGNMNRGPAAKNEVTRPIPVAQLNPYQDRWTIKARVTAKSDMRSYNNKKGAGKLFSFEVVDAQGGEIRITCFNTQADMFFGLIEIDKVYLISRGNLKPAQKMYNPLNHDYEISLDFRSTVDPCPEDDSVIPRLRYNFRPISELESIEVGAIVDLIGIVTSVAPSATITRKDGSEAQKRTFQLKDMSGRSVEVTLWGKFCDAEGQQLQSLCDSGLNPVLALRSVRVTEFNASRNVNSIGTTQLKVNPDFPEAESLRQWYVTEGKTAACVSLSAASMGRTVLRKTIAQIKDENLGQSEKPDWVTVKGAVSHLPTDGTFCYPACTLEVNGRQCSKKVTNNGDGTWQCDRCDQSMPNCEYRYTMQCQFQDHTGTTYATVFQEAGLEIMAYSAQELFEIREEDAERYAEILQGIRWQQFLFKLKVKEETYNDEARVKYTIVKAEKLDPSRESSYLLGVINNLSQADTDSPPEVQGPMAYSGGFNNVGAGQGAPTSNSAYTTNMSGPRYGESMNQLAQAANMHGGASTPLSATRPVQQSYMPSSGYNVQNYSAGVHRQQPAASAAISFGSSQPDNVGSGLCSRCHQPGHVPSACPMLGSTAPPREPYASEATSGGYSRQPQQRYVGATSYNY